jgi:hypothetical protein
VEWDSPKFAYTEFYEVHPINITTWHISEPTLIEKNGHMADGKIINKW